MPIASSDLELHLSGGSSNTDPNASLGGVMSTTTITTSVANNLWDDVTGAQSSAGLTEHRAVYIKNVHGSITWVAPVLWIDSQVSPAGSQFDVALASEAVGVSIAQTLGTEASVPTGVTFTTPTTKGGGLTIADIPAGSRKGIWIRRVVSAGASAASATGSIRVEGDTTA